MKIGEALNQRKYLMNHIPQILKALQGCVTVVQGAPVNRAEPTASELYAALHSEQEELQALIVSINRTNNVSKLPCGLTVMEGIARREYLKGAQGNYSAVASAIRPRTEKDYRDSERVTYVIAEGIHPANVKELANTCAREWRRLDNELQQANWTIDLVGM